MRIASAGGRCYQIILIRYLSVLLAWPTADSAASGLSPRLTARDLMMLSCYSRLHVPS